MNAFTKKVSNITENIKHDMVIKDLENKKNMLHRAVQNEISEIDGKIQQQIIELGNLVYDLYMKNEITPEAFTGGVENISRLKEEIEVKEQKITEISQRYDEEISMIVKLKSAESSNADNQSDGNSSQSVCSSCQTPYVQGDVFCKKCGNKLPVITEEANSESKSEVSTVCDKCKTPYVQGKDMFCKNCGNKL
jgi:hypothetical protein